MAESPGARNLREGRRRGAARLGLVIPDLIRDPPFPFPAESTTF